MNGEIQQPIDAEFVEDAQDAGLEIATSNGKFFVIIDTEEDAETLEQILNGENRS